ncbi:uncharacterized protein B0I36DRAFT_359721 [Microdochium trichocladiopsis]|uniref:J domain-containing protein n=1 Tax=Microdochium trichocladiopsis TaxID=1682393 RepID=A0A9P8YFT2_9PEZI|nr:uncharacterized protein B0I36DRAFT_359721 [Microdochium trichocladiopsis]KAH7038122.1 hypothetical protein B0I36DRAFT_359721 [Microdochium trichocladiopsis]
MADTSAAAAAAELLAHARAFASSNQDLYALLGVDATTPRADIHRAWRKTSLRYHPDKAGDSFDPEKWQLFERARDVLSDPAAREAYDTQRSANLIREQAKMAMDDRRRRMVEDLEAREKAGAMAAAAGAAGQQTGAGDASNTMSEQERKKTAEAGRKRVEERQRLMREAEERERQRAAEKEEADLKREADLERRIGEIQARKAAKEAARRQQAEGGSEGAEAGMAEKVVPDGDVDMADRPAPPPTTTTTASAKSGAESRQQETRPHVLEAQQKAEKLAAEAAAIPRVRGDFSHTYARLKAAQAVKEARQLAREGMAA